MHQEPTEEPVSDYVVRPSKTEKKRELDRLKIFADQLVALPSGRLARLELPDDVKRSLTEARRTESRSALKRQLAHLSGLLEGVDVGAIKDVLQAMDHGLPKPKAAPAPENKVAAGLLDGGDQELFALTERYAHGELQMLRQAVRQAKKQLNGSGPRAAALKVITSCLARLTSV